MKEHAKRAVAQLNDLDGDPETSHSMADEILLDYLKSIGDVSLADAFERARKRIGFWYA